MIDIVHDGQTLVLSGDFDVRSTMEVRTAIWEHLLESDQIGAGLADHRRDPADGAAPIHAQSAPDIVGQHPHPITGGNGRPERR